MIQTNMLGALVNIAPNDNFPEGTQATICNVYLIGSEVQYDVIDTDGKLWTCTADQFRVALETISQGDASHGN